MLKPALIELDSAAIELRYFAAEVVHDFLPRYQWPVNHAELFSKAIDLIFEDALVQYLSWTPKGRDMLEEKVTEALGLTALVGSLQAQAEEAYHAAMDEAIADRVFPCIISQLTQVIGTQRYHAWHVLPLGTARILTPGGIMLDLDRLQGQSGIIEVSLAEHWSPLAKAGGPQVETGPALPLKDVPETSRATPGSRHWKSRRHDTRVKA